MKRFLPAAVVVASCFLVSACASDGMVAKSRMRTLLSKSAPEDKVKIIVLDVQAERGTVVAGEGTLSDIRRLPGVLQADRGAGPNDILILAELDTDSSYFVDALRPRYRVHVEGEYLREELGGE